MKSEASHAADNIARKIKKHVFGKGVRRICDQGPPGREGTPLMYVERLLLHSLGLTLDKVSNNPSASP